VSNPSPKKAKGKLVAQAGADSRGRPMGGKRGGRGKGAEFLSVDLGGGGPGDR